MRRDSVLVVGVHQGQGCASALDFALREALARRMMVEVVTAWTWSSPYPGMDTAVTLEGGRFIAERVQDDAIRRSVARVGGRAPLVQLTMHDFGGRALVRRSENAAVLVLGSGRNDTKGVPSLRSVRDFCLNNATVPVIVVPHLVGDLVLR